VPAEVVESNSFALQTRQRKPFSQQLDRYRFIGEIFRR
jgi:hypothetical protein